jgi:hypothetical protein
MCRISNILLLPSHDPMRFAQSAFMKNWNPCLFALIVSITFLNVVSLLEAESKEDRGKSAPKVTGTAQVCAQVEAALILVREKAPDVHDLIQKNVAIIAEGKRSGMWAYKNPPTYEISNTSALYSIPWCAGTIAHDAYHSKLYHDYLNAKGAPVPDEVWTGVEAERLCIAFQLSVLRKIGAPKHEIEYCIRLNGRHYDVNKDGRYDWDDYFKRKW